MIIVFLFVSDEKYFIDGKEFIITRSMFTFQTVEKIIEGNYFYLIL